MKRSVKELIGYSIFAKDGIKGDVSDFLFDEDTWTVRYLEADLGNWFKGRRVLVPRVFLGEPEWNNSQFKIHLTKDALKDCPDRDDHKPVSRKYEELLNKHFSISNYWGVTGMTAPAAYPLPWSIGREHIPSSIKTDAEQESKLRSFKELKGYRVECSDKKKGHVKDFVIDDNTWQILFLIVDVGQWTSNKDKLVALPISQIESINFIEKSMGIYMDSVTLEESPEFQPDQPINIEYEKNLYDFYGRKVEQRQY
ncbi:PRC-barrel domain-containing protein [Flammeovirgaceae bacterium SG7u.111]|nr:PRC-barrel domain-containing protein [Flammeovirgaceae bacterium SG7u.132]WPO34082.1 PRC-barrel domain-containing protein [Flammeovirgaceae bacterium SG7u.111]